MASLATHITAFLFLVPTGLTRLVRSSSLFLQNPSLFQSRPCYTLSDQPRWKNLEFYALTVSLPFAVFSEAFLFLSSVQFSDENPTLRFAIAHQSLLLFLFWALLVLIALRENVDFFRDFVNEGLIFVFAGVSFVSEYWVTGKGMNGVFSDAYGTLGLLALLCGFCSFCLAINPSSFFAEFLLSSGLVLKGTWVLQIGLCSNTEAFGLRGCGSGKVVNLNPKCELEQDGFRAVALMRLLFTVHAVFVLVLELVSFGVLANNQRLRSGVGSLLSQLDSESLMISDCAELEMD